jgi:type II secretory pathway pseudopilin PulG
MKNLKKYSFTLIELVVAIVVVGIVVTAIPALLNRGASIQETNLKEKSFFNAFALLTLIQTQEWDENNTKDDNYYKVLTAENGDSELKCSRIGTVLLDNDSGADCANTNHKTSAIGVDSTETKGDESTYDDIDDFNEFYTVVDDINISVSVRYMDDGVTNGVDYSAKNIYFSESDAAVSGTNLKFVVLSVRKVDTNELISVLKYTTSNIGMVKIESRNE